MTEIIVSFNETEYSENLEKYIEKIKPYGLIFFSKNIKSKIQLKSLVSSIKNNFPSIKLAIDLEGGLVNRFRKIEGDIPLPENKEKFLEFGKRIGFLLNYYGFDIDFAPVVDIDRGVKGNGLDGRYLGKSVDEVIEKASDFLEGLESEGITGCLKHYIGLSYAKIDSHFGLPEIEEIKEEDELPFRVLSKKNRLIMFAHIKIKGYGISTYSKKLVNRVKSFHKGKIVTDDLGMKALPVEKLTKKIEKVSLAGFDFAIVSDMISGFNLPELL
ncbi:beta-N-acetylhexosaminidase [Thermotomaculum hydrothermale]|uniref:beta-N-acetylhexosaminidase n=1 Tax=Thermotomaculum hydrothermale TaxID=981385 RepID=A0A7R6Q0K3_9BACT|nr:glycoside hydrolase family 3 protein [Thermotomaculum hydrothermale]BBB33328.1 beta-N-acetylhexosaminidase [Thermotomaculum hydrothermale]